MRRRRNPEYKPLEEYSSVEEVEAALAAGDTELAEELDDLVESAIRALRRGSGVSYDSTPLEDDEILYSFDPTDTFDSRILSLSKEAQKQIADDMRGTLEYELKTGLRRSSRFSLNWERFRSSDYMSWEIPSTYQVIVEPQFYNPELIPSEYAEQFWEKATDELPTLASGWEEPTDSVTDYNYGYVEAYENPELYLYGVAEFVSDHFREYVENLDEHSKIDLFTEHLRQEIGEQDTKLLVSQLKEEELLDFVDSWLSDDEYEQESLSEKLAHYAEILKDPSALLKQREVILEVSPEVLSQIGVTKGVIKEEAPWHLISLQPEDLSIEGALMKHCVGQYSMGYQRAVERGEIQIWSFRDRNGKPRFTVEVDTSFYETDDPDEKARAIKQLKGKGNRTPGYAQSRSSSIKFPEEVEVWDYILSELGVNPASVSDFYAFRNRERPEVRANPRRRPRSFDEPYRPLKRRF